MKVLPQLWQDLKIDPGYAKRGRIDRNGLPLTVERAKALHAALYIRMCLLLSLLFSLQAWEREFELETWVGEVSYLAIGLCLIGIMLWIFLADFARQADVFALIQPTPVPRHHKLEVIAIPLLVFATVVLLFVLIPLQSFLISTHSPLLTFTYPFFWFVDKMPWSGLTALLIAFGAYQRWKEAVGQSASPNAPQIAT
jgi:uncharacterized membrane protein YidH (DUF202 family)